MKSFHDGKVILHAGDCMEVLRTMPADSIDAVCTDPPYHLTSIVKRFGAEDAAPAKGNEAFIRASKGFMGKQWDGGDIAFRPELWAEVLRVLKPGGHMVCFGGTRTYHRMVCAIEDAGFEIRDQLAWVYGSGFPKSHDVSKGIDRAAGIERERIERIRVDGKPTGQNGGWKNSGCDVSLVSGPAVSNAARQWQGWGTALKPAWEPICLARKPLSESTVAANVLRWGTGALNIDGCRIESNGDRRDPRGADGVVHRTTGAVYGEHAKSDFDLSKSRWPANLCHDGSPEVMAGFPETGISNGGGMKDLRKGKLFLGETNPNVTDACGFGDSGSAARFFASFPQEKNPCQSLNGHASYAENSFILSSGAAVFVLNRAVEASTQRLVLHQQSYRALATNVSGQLLDEIETLLIGTIQNIEKRFLRGLLPEKHFLSNSRANVAATPKPTGTTTITISLLTSNGPAEVATFDLIETNSEAGELASAKRFHYTAKADADDRLGSKHPTVKPVDLMQWLVRLVCQKGATVLDPFAGTGTTGAATFIEGCRAVLIEREAEYLADIERRMGMLLSGADERARKLATPDPYDSLPLFAVMP